MVGDAGNKELVGGIRESKRVEDTTEGGQDTFSSCASDDDNDDASVTYSAVQP